MERLSPTQRISAESRGAPGPQPSRRGGPAASRMSSEATSARDGQSVAVSTSTAATTNSGQNNNVTRSKGSAHRPHPPLASRRR
jgi:hypothetical protein